MTEKEKAAAGYLFDPSADPQNAKDITRCIDLCHAYNQCTPSDFDAKRRILEQIIGRMGKNVVITAPFWCDHGYNISIGDDFYSNHNLVITDGAKVTFGDHVFIAPNCCFTTAEHAIDAEQRNRGLEVAKPIQIGNNVWIGAGATILAGVTIGDNTVIGAGSLVKRTFPPTWWQWAFPARCCGKSPRRIRTDTRGKALQPAYRLKTPWGKRGRCKCAAFAPAPFFNV